MGSLLGGKQKSTSTTRVDIPYWVQGPLKEMLTRTVDLTNKPYEAYTGDRIAGFTPDEQAAFDSIRGMQGQGIGDYNYANDVLKQVTQSGTDGFSQDYLNKYMNPYQTNVLDVAKGRALDQFSNTMRDYNSRAGQIGSFGGSRVALGQGQLQDNFSRQLQENETLGLASNYNQALGAAERGMARAGQGALGLAGLADSQQGYGIRDATALQGSGQAQRQMNQLGLDQQYEDYLTEKQYPYQQLEFLANIGMPLGQMTAGSTTTSTQKSGAGGLSKALGIASMFAAPFTGGASLMGGLGSGLGSLGASAMMGIGGLQGAQTAFNMGSAMGNTGMMSQALFGDYAEGGMVPFKKHCYANGGRVEQDFDLMSPQGLAAFRIAMAEAERAIKQGDGSIQYTEGDTADYLPFDSLDQSEKDARLGLASVDNSTSRPMMKQDYLNQYLAAQPNSVVRVPKGSKLTLDMFKNIDISGHKYEKEINKAAKETGLPAGFIAAKIDIESSKNPKAVSNKGAVGLTQLMEDAAKEMGVKDRTDPLQNIVGGAKYLAKQYKRFNGDLELALSAYNAGATRVKEAGNKIPDIKETKDYVEKYKKKAKYADGGVVDSFSSWLNEQLAQGAKNRESLTSWLNEQLAQGAKNRESLTSWLNEQLAQGAKNRESLNTGLNSLRTYLDSPTYPKDATVADYLNPVSAAKALVGTGKQTFDNMMGVGDAVYKGTEEMLGMKPSEVGNRLSRVPSDVSWMLGQNTPKPVPTKVIKPVAPAVPLKDQTAQQQLDDILSLTFSQPETKKQDSQPTPKSPVAQGLASIAAQPEESKTSTKRGINFPLLAFGATLLASDDDFFHALGQAGAAYGNTSMSLEKQDKEYAAAKEASRQKAIMDMIKVKQDERGLDIRQQTADAYTKQNTPSPFKEPLEKAKLALLLKKLDSSGTDDKFRQKLVLQAMAMNPSDPVSAADSILAQMGQGDTGDSMTSVDPEDAMASDMGLQIIYGD